MADQILLALARFRIRQSVDGEDKCVTCGKGADGRMLHGVKHEGAFRQLCSSCILFYNRCMHCSICYQVYSDPRELGDPALWITCCKCLRLSHMHCFNQDFPSSDMSSSVCIHCSASCSFTEPSTWVSRADTLSMESSGHDEAVDCSVVPSCKKPRMNKELGLNQMEVKLLNAPLVNQEVLAAAKLVSILAAKEAAVAKAKAFALAEVAAKAAARAKAALDIAHRAGHDEARFKAQLVRQSVSGAGDPSVYNGGDNNEEGIQDGTEEADTRIVRNDHEGQITRTVALIEENETYMVMPPSSDPSFSSNEETTEMPFDSDEVTVQDYLFSMHDIDDQSHEELGLEVIALASSEGLLAGSFRLDVLQDPPHLSTHHSCTPRPDGEFTSVSQEFVEVNGMQETDGLVHETTNSSKTLSSRYSNEELQREAFMSGQRANDPGEREISLPVVTLSEREMLEYHATQDKSVLNMRILSSDVNSVAISTEIDVGTEAIIGNVRTIAPQFTNSEQEVCSDVPVKHNNFPSNLVTDLEEFNDSALTTKEDQMRYQADAALTNSTINWSNQGLEMQCALIGNNTEQAAKSIMSTMNNTNIDLACLMPVMTPALSGVSAGWQL